MSTPISAPIQRFIDATNAGDTPAFLAAFTADAFLSDWGRDFTGREHIARWNQSDNIGVKSHLHILGIEQVGETYNVRIAVSGGGYNGEGKMAFTLRGDEIARLVIS